MKSISTIILIKLCKLFTSWPSFNIVIALMVHILFNNVHFVNCESSSSSSQLVTDHYYGTPLGPISPGTIASGNVYASDENTLFIKGFNFNGTLNPFSYFQAGATFLPDGTGFTIADEKGTFNQLGNYHNKDLILKLPEGRTIRDIRWFAIWSRNNHLALGHISIPIGVDLPRPLELPGLTPLAHGVRSSPITIVDAQTILIPNFWYDGLGPAAYWWATRGPRQSPQGLRLKDEKGSVRPLRAYHGETVMLMLPDTKTIYDFDWIGIWCEEFQVDFGHVHIPQHVRVPPSPAMLGLKPEAKLNCEVFDDLRGYEMRWILDGDDIVIQLVGRMLPNEYMAIGWGRDDTRSLMIGADAVVTWIDAAGQGHAIDYYITAKEPCIGQHGVCPDLNHPGATDSVTLLHAAVVNGFRMITFKRPQLGVDERLDQHIYSDGQQAIIWSYGPLNSRNQLSYHTNHQYGNRYIDFARQPKWNCPSPDQALMQQRKWQQMLASASNSNQSTSNTRDTRMISEPFTNNTADQTAAESLQNDLEPWTIPKIICPKDGILWAQMGPTGGPKRGYQARTKRHGWGIAWYINGLMIPEIVLKRGTTYTFWVEGGNDHENNAQRHPLYLTTSPEGGYDYKTPDERRNEQVIAGVGMTANGTTYPIAEGRNCRWKVTSRTNIDDIDGSYPTFEDFRKTLDLDCDVDGQPARLQFTPDKNTPDLIYYQCYLHRFMGWKIHIVDQCPNELTAAESKSNPTRSTMGLASSSSTPSRVQIAFPSVAIKPKTNVKQPKNRSQNVLFHTNTIKFPKSLNIRPYAKAHSNISPIVSTSAIASPPGTFVLHNLDHVFDSYINDNGYDMMNRHHRMPLTISANIPSSIVNPYNSPQMMNYLHQQPPNLPPMSTNQMMKKFGVRFTNNHNNGRINNKTTTSKRIHTRKWPSKFTKLSNTTTTTMRNQQFAHHVKPLKIQTDGFVPMINGVHNLHNNQRSPSSWPKIKTKNKFNPSDVGGFGTEDILRIRPTDATLALQPAPTTPPTTTTTTTTTTTSTTVPPPPINYLDGPANSFVDRKIFSALEYSNGLFSDEIDSDSDKPLQSSASTTIMKYHQHRFPANQQSNTTSFDQTILMDVMRMIAHDSEQRQRQSY